MPRWFSRWLNYEYSASSFTLYLGLRGVKLEEYGFGNWNLWHYQHDDIDRCYEEQLVEHGLENPMLFVSTPTLHSREALVYGANLTPKHVNIGKVDYHSPFCNLWLIGATAGTPSFAGGTHFARMIYERLTDERLPLSGDQITDP